MADHDVRQKNMNPSQFDAIYVIQGLYQSAGTLSVMTDATSRTFAEMHTWRYETKEEMKHLGGTIFKMQDKFVELMILGVSKMVEDFFNDLEEFKQCPIKIWDPGFDGCRFASETRRIRHLGNVIKHNNSIIDSSRGQSSAALVSQYGMKDDTPIHWQEVFRGPVDETVFQSIFMAYEFCQDVMVLQSVPFARQTTVPLAGIKEVMLTRYVRSIPGHPEYED